MAGQIRLFEKNADGSLVEVPAKDAEAARVARRFSHTNLAADILFTAEEEAARDAEEAAIVAAQNATEQEQADVAANKQAAIQKLGKLGLTSDEIAAIAGK